MTTLLTINLATEPIVGQLSVKASAVENLVLPASTSGLSLPLPTGLTTAAFVIITAVTTTDLTVKLSSAGGATALSVPYKKTLMVYDATQILVTSAIGGQVQLVVG